MMLERSNKCNILFCFYENMSFRERKDIKKKINRKDMRKRKKKIRERRKERKLFKTTLII